MTPEPLFLTFEQVEAIHARPLDEHGGAGGVRDPGALEAAVMPPLNVYYDLGSDLYGIAAAYAFHIAEAHAYLDGNKRTAIASALIFLEVNGIDTRRFDPMELYQPMIDVSAGELDREDLASRLRGLLA